MRSAPLTTRQTLLWLDHELFPKAPYSNFVLTWELLGELDLPRLHTAFEGLVQDHDALKCRVRSRDGSNQLAVDESFGTKLVLHDLSAAPAELERLVRTRACIPLVPHEQTSDALLIKLGPTRHVLYLAQHHIVSDRTSLVAFCEQLAARYSQRKPEVGPSLLDYARFEQSYVTSADGRRDAEFWANRLKGGVPPPALYGVQRTSRAVGLRATTLRVPEQVSRGLLQQATQPMFKCASGTDHESVNALDQSRLNVLLTALFAYMYRVSGSRLLAVALPMPNRNPEFRHTLGCLREQPLVVVELDEGETIRSLAGKTGRALAEAIQHGRHTSHARDVSYCTLIMEPRIAAELSGLDSKVSIGRAPIWLEREPHTSGDLRDTLTLIGFEDGDHGLLALELHLHSQTYSAEQQTRALDHLLQVLTSVACDPERSVDGIALVSDREQATLLSWARGAAPPQAPDLVRRFREQVGRRGEALAVLSEVEQLSYRELDQRSDKLAAELAALGVGTQSRVGVFLRRGVDELLTLLATLKLGAAYVPLDPAHPAERIQMVIDDAAPQVLVSERELARTLHLTGQVKVLALDEQWPSIHARPPTAVEAVYRAEQIAYVLFTSGSTGRPKGVAISRGAFANFLQSMAHTPGMSERDRLLAITTITFDISGLELFLPLWVGATIQIASREVAMDPALLRAVLEREPVTVLQATPATLRLLVEAGFEGRSDLRVLVGGEALSPELARSLTSRCAQLWNMYGPTETTVWSTVKQIAPDAAPDASRITIGRPIDHTECYVLDAERHLVPEGVVGELYIGGRGLAQGYLGRDDLTQERFVQNPFGPEGERIYRTGDLARVLDQGELECLGRVDHQVKIRGFRIELGEIESVLRGTPGVRDAVVMARRDSGPDPRLVAYVLADLTFDETALVARARERLPHYMHPSAYVRLDVFPLNTSGKVDRKVLPPPETHASVAHTVTHHARSDLEHQLAAIWCDLLGKSAVDTTHDFFALGGNSVLAVTMRARIQQQLGVELSMAALFEQPTVAGLARAIESGDRSDRSIVVPLRRSTSERAPLFCMLGITLYHELAQCLDTDRSVWGIHVPYGLDPAHPLPSSVVELAAAHIEAIRSVHASGPYHLAGLCFGGVIAHEVARQLEGQGERVLSVTVLDAVLSGGRLVDRSKQLIHFAKRALTDPSRARGWFGDQRDVLRAKVRQLVPRSYQMRRNQHGPQLAGGQRVDPDLLGPEVQAATDSWERRAQPIQAPVLLFRAGTRDLSPWFDLASHFGWDRLAPTLSVHDVSGDHLDILRRPNVEQIARVLDLAFSDE